MPSVLGWEGFGKDLVWFLPVGAGEPQKVFEWHRVSALFESSSVQDGLEKRAELWGSTNLEG
jgi:hypothetical protein